MVFRSKLKVGKSNCDEGCDDEQDNKDDAEYAVECVRLIESPNCRRVGAGKRHKQQMTALQQKLPAAKSSEISM